MQHAAHAHPRAHWPHEHRLPGPAVAHAADGEAILQKSDDFNLRLEVIQPGIVCQFLNSKNIGVMGWLQIRL